MNKSQFKEAVCNAMGHYGVLGLPTGLEPLPYALTDPIVEEKVTWKDGEWDWVLIKEGREFRISVSNWERGNRTRKDTKSYACYLWHNDNKPKGYRQYGWSPYALGHILTGVGW